MPNDSRSVDEATMTHESPTRGARSNEERELAGYLDELVSATFAGKSPGNYVAGRETNEPASTELDGPEPEGAALPEPISEVAAPQEKPPPSGRQTRGTTRASMREGLLALFRDTERLSPPPPSAPTTANGPKLPATEPSVFLRRFLEPATRSPELAPSGLASLDARLDGGFGSGLHLVQGEPGVGKTAFLESVAWEAVSAERPVLYYALKEGTIGAWERLISTLGNILGTAIPLDTLRARTLGPDELETLTRLDLALQASVLPYLSLIETIPASTDNLSALIEDVRLRAQGAKERHGKIPLLLIDDLERLLLLTRAQPLLHVLSRLDDALVADSMPGLLAMTPPDRSAYGQERLPAQTTLALVSVSAFADEAFGRVDLELRTNARTGWTGTLPLLLDRHSGLFTDPSL
ncbi:MAG TPA: DnaB-like helicase C-terminal domain-containing protein [Thermoleophilia bacterium]